ncbi:PIG-L deacetylase family protein [Ornithinibacillus californiensis]|uniref:PIG-L deacetylase family protein n=1 Tax=Ornithinibacillus californiensis TaxID=161536 RepID=UPI00064D92C0|nr:PIG-L family deacetylase [Ornithinibacillus californiensis]
MNVKQLLITILKPINIPLTRFILQRHYKQEKQLSTTKNAKRILVFAPHMDDETIGPGGVIRKHANEGAEVHCVFVTDGSNSVSDLSKEELTRIRMEETEKVKHILGITSIQYLGLPDGKVRSNEESQSKFKEMIDQVKPDIIYTTSFIDAHTDHTQTAKTLADVLRNSEYQDVTIRMYEINCPIPPEFINCVVDISDTIEEKKKAINVFSSQKIAFDGFVELNRLKTNLIQEEVEAVEVFVEPTIDSFIQHCDKLATESKKFPAMFKQANRTDTLLWAIYKNLDAKKQFYKQSIEK